MAKAPGPDACTNAVNSGTLKKRGSPLTAFGRRTPEAGLRAIRPSFTAMSIISETTRWICRTVDGLRPEALNSPTHTATSDVATAESR